MGFNKKERQEAQRQQEMAYQAQLEATRKAEEAQKQYQSSFDQRNAPIISLQQQSQKNLDDIKNGKDFSGIYSSLFGSLQAGSDLTKKSYEAINTMGTNTWEKNDPKYTEKLRSLSERQLARGMGQDFASGVNQEKLTDEEQVVKTTDYLNADRMGGLGLNNQNISNYGNLFGTATTRRQSAIQESQLGWQGLGAILGGATGAISGFGSVMNMFKPK